jgi:hypothetical protein
MITIETKRAKRRTFKEVAKDAYERGFAEGVDRATKNAEEELNAMVRTNLELGYKINGLETELANVSLRQLAWSRITGLFGARS